MPTPVALRVAQVSGNQSIAHCVGLRYRCSAGSEAEDKQLETWEHSLLTTMWKCRTNFGWANLYLGDVSQYAPHEKTPLRQQGGK